MSAGRVKDDVMSRITIAMPKARDGAKREPFIPESVKESMSGGAAAMDTPRTTERDLMWSQGGPGVYVCDYRKYYVLEEDEWKFDTIPEFMDGKNVMDFFDADIEQRLAALEAEEAELEAQGAYAPEDDDEDELGEDEIILHKAIRGRQEIARKESHITKPNVPHAIRARSKDAAQVREHLESHGLEADGLLASVSRGRKRARTPDVRSKGHGRPDVLPDNQDAGDDMDDGEGRSRSRSRSQSVSTKHMRNAHVRSTSVQSRSATRGPRASSVAPGQKLDVFKAKKKQERANYRFAAGGDADRKHTGRDAAKLVKHLNSGKRSLGTSTIGR